MLSGTSTTTTRSAEMFSAAVTAAEMFSAAVTAAETFPGAGKSPYEFCASASGADGDGTGVTSSTSSIITTLPPAAVAAALLAGPAGAESAAVDDCGSCSVATA